MKHVCIITYSFLPLNFVATWRQYYRAKYLAQNGYHVTIITRHWKKGDQYRSPSSTKSAEIIKEELWDGVDVIRTPAGSSHLRRQLSLWKRTILSNALAPGRMLSTLYRQLAYFLLPMDYHLRLVYSRHQIRQLINKRPDVVIASGDPWHIFEVGNDLAEAFNCKLICEYRDPWNYRDERFRVEGFNSFNTNPLSQLKRWISIKREQRLTKNADAIVSVSVPWTQNASTITGIQKAFTITNGFEPEEFEEIEADREEVFTITYIGNLHAPPQQNITPFIHGLTKFLGQDTSRLLNTKVQFVGTADSYNFSKTQFYLEQCPYYDDVFELTGKVDKPTSIQIQKSSYVLLFVAHEKLVGQYPAKIFEYLAAGTPIMLAPDDHDVCSELIKMTATGRACNTKEEVAAYLEELYTAWSERGRVPYTPVREQLEKYKYKEQNKKLIRILENELE
jgi:glycosyltransferase involved in cell wall biosynthesis